MIAFDQATLQNKFLRPFTVLPFSIHRASIQILKGKPKYYLFYFIFYFFKDVKGKLLLKISHNCFRSKGRSLRFILK